MFPVRCFGTTWDIICFRVPHRYSPARVIKPRETWNMALYRLASASIFRVVIGLTWWRKQKIFVSQKTLALRLLLALLTPIGEYWRGTLNHVRDLWTTVSKPTVKYEKHDTDIWLSLAEIQTQHLSNKTQIKASNRKNLWNQNGIINIFLFKHTYSYVIFVRSCLWQLVLRNLFAKCSVSLHQQLQISKSCFPKTTAQWNNRHPSTERILPSSRYTYIHFQKAIKYLL